jgi:hypothetical protein
LPLHPSLAWGSTMVDKPTRLKAAHLIEDFTQGKLTNDEFVDRCPKSADKSLRAISSMTWFAYSDLREHRLEGKHALTDKGKEMFQRCIVFLNTELEYSGPDDLFDATAGLKRLWHWITRSTEPVEPEWMQWWPFDSLEQFNRYKANQGI